MLATPATFQGALFASVVERFAQGVNVLPQTLPGLVERIEAGDLEGPETRRIVEAGVRPLVAQGVDTLVLACTHYPFVIPLIEDVAGPGVRVIDPSPAVARQAGRVLAESGQPAASGEAGATTFVSSGDAAGLAGMAKRLIGETGVARHADWDTDGSRLSLTHAR